MDFQMNQTSIKWFAYIHTYITTKEGKSSQDHTVKMLYKNIALITWL